MVVITLIFTIFIGAVLSLLSVSFYNKYIKTGLIENADANLSFMVDSINENISEVNRLVSFCQTHSYISRFMKYTGTGSPSTALLAYDRLNDEYLVNPASDYIHRITATTATCRLLMPPTRHHRTWLKSQGRLTSTRGSLPPKSLISRTDLFQTHILTEPRGMFLFL